MPRRLLDRYETPPHYTEALLGEVDVLGHIYEPCVGKGAISSILQDLGLPVDTNDIDWKCKADMHYDACSPIAWLHKTYDWIITNPPFSDELAILEHAIDAAPNVAFLARLSFLEPTEDRAYFLEQHPPTRVIVLPRYSFRLNDAGKKATDSVTCCWLVWSPEVTPGIAAWGRGRSEAAATMRTL